MKAAQMSAEVGFDGVEIDSGQMLRSDVNLPTRSSSTLDRFPLELVKSIGAAIGAAIGTEKVAILLSRYGDVKCNQSFLRNLREQSRGRLSYVRFADTREGQKSDEREEFGRKMDLRWTRECLGPHIKVFCDVNGGSAKDAVGRGEIHGLVFEEPPTGWGRGCL